MFVMFLACFSMFVMFLACFSMFVMFLACLVTSLVPRETAAVSAQILCTAYNHARVYSVTLFEAIIIRRVHVRLAGNCHLHF